MKGGRSRSQPSGSSAGRVAPRRSADRGSSYVPLAAWTGGNRDPVTRQQLAAVYAHERLREITRLRADATRWTGGAPGPEGSLGKLLWVQGMTKIAEVAATLLGPRITANTGEWGTFAWAQHLLGAPGYRIAGGSDEIQRNIIAERSLGLPPEPRVDRDVPWRALPRSAPGPRLATTASDGAARQSPSRRRGVSGLQVCTTWRFFEPARRTWLATFPSCGVFWQ